MSIIASLPTSTYGPNASAAGSQYAHDPYYTNKYRDEHPSDDSFSDDGSLGPREFIAPSLPTKHYSTYGRPAEATATAALPTPVVAAPTSLVAASAHPALTPLTSVEAMSLAMTFLPLEDIEIARNAGPLFAAAADRVAPRPLGTDDVVFVRWEPLSAAAESHHVPQYGHGAFKGSSPSAAARRAAGGVPPVFPWRCLSCGTITSGPRACQSCRAPLASSACRVFLGQLRKDLSADLATAMVRSLCPTVNVLHMESHTNGAEGRGKGCAWAYVNSVEDAQQLVALHKRVFVDLDADNGEGFWFIKDPALKLQLSAMAETLGAARGRPLWLPRQALVAELPSKSLLAEYLNSLPAAF